MASGVIEWIEFPAPDPEVLALFYAAVFGWEVVEYHEPPYVFTDTAGTVRGGFTTALEPMTEYGIMVSITVDDLDHTLEAAAANSGELVLGRVALPGDAGSFASIRDPAGNRISLYEGDITSIAADQ